MRKLFPILILWFSVSTGNSQCSGSGPLACSGATKAQRDALNSREYKTTIVSGPGIFYTIREPIVPLPITILPPPPPPPTWGWDYYSGHWRIMDKQDWRSNPGVGGPVPAINRPPLPDIKPLGTVARELREKKAKAAWNK